MMTELTVDLPGKRKEGGCLKAEFGIKMGGCGVCGFGRGAVGGSDGGDDGDDGYG